MSTQFRTIAIVCMVLVLMSAPCLAACPYSVSGNSASTDDGSYSGCGQTSCTDKTCSTCQNNAYSPYASGAFKCTDGNCVGEYCVNGKCDTTEVTDSSAGNATGAVVCKNGTCEAKVCDGNGTCETGSFSTSGDDSTVAAWFSKIFGGSSDSSTASTETSTCETGSQEITTPSTETEETTTPSSNGVTYTVTGSSTPKTSSTNFFGTYAMTGATDSNETPVENVTPVVTTCSTCTNCQNDTACESESCKDCKQCSQCEKTESTSVTNSTKESGACDSYDTVYAAVRADKTEKNVLSDSYTSLNFAQDVCAAMKAEGIDCQIVKVTFTDGSVNYLNAFETCNGQLLVDSCGTALGTGIKKQVTVLEIGQQWTAKSLFGECTKTYTRGTVSSIE